MYFRHIILRLFVFTLLFTLIFFSIRHFNLLPHAKLTQNINSIPWLFSAIALVFSIISGFVIQSKWHTWDELIDATHGELSAFRQLNSMVNHFPKEFQDTVRKKICHYLNLIIKEAKETPELNKRSETVENALYDIESTLYDSKAKYPEAGELTFSILREGMNYREQRLQSTSHTLPTGVRVFVICATIMTIFSSLFIGVTSVIYDYMFTLMIALLSYGIYLLIDDLDHPYRPGEWHLKPDEYAEVLHEVEKLHNH